MCVHPRNCVFLSLRNTACVHSVVPWSAQVRQMATIATNVQLFCIIFYIFHCFSTCFSYFLPRSPHRDITSPSTAYPAADRSQVRLPSVGQLPLRQWQQARASPKMLQYSQLPWCQAIWRPWLLLLTSSSWEKDHSHLWRPTINRAEWLITPPK